MDIRLGFPYTPVAGSRQCVEQRLRVFDIGSVEAFREPAVTRREQFAASARRWRRARLATAQFSKLLLNVDFMRHWGNLDDTGTKKVAA